MESKYTVIHAG